MTIFASVFLEDVFQRVLNPVFPADDVPIVLPGFTFDVQTNNSGPSNNDQFTVPTLSGGTYDGTTTVDWGDGNIDTNMATFDDARWTHTFTGGAGPYTVRITGTFRGFRFNSSGDRQKITDISQWGQLQLTNNGSHFAGCSNLLITATDSLDLAGLTTLLLMFTNCTSLVDVPSLEDWDYSNILNIAGMFQNCFVFVGTVEGMGISNVTNMSLTFTGCLSFNSPIIGLPTGSVINFSQCWSGCFNFNQPVNGLDTSSAVNMSFMFQTNVSLNQPMNLLDTSNVTNFFSFLRNASTFDQDLSALDYSSATIMTTFLQNVTLSTSNYNALLLSLDAQTLQPNVSFHGGNSTYDSTQLSVATLTSSGNVATVTTDDPHGLDTNDRMVISGALPTGYRLVETVTRISSTVFTYPIAGPLSSPATGTIFCEVALPAIARASVLQNDSWTIIDGGAV